MITLFIFCIKCLYWLIIGWWLKPILYFKNLKYKKIEREIVKEEYRKIKGE